MLASVLKLTTSFTASERRTQLHSCHSGHAQNIKWFFATSWIGFQQLSREENIGWTHFKCQGNKVMISELISDMQSMQGFWTMHQSGKTRTITQAPQTQKHLWYPLWHGLQVILYGLLLRIHTVHQQPVAISAVLKVNSTVKTVSGPGQLQCPKRYFKTFHAISSCSSPRHWT